MSSIKRITSPSNLTCGRCKKPIREGQEAYWILDEGTYHIECIDAPSLSLFDLQKRSQALLADIQQTLADTDHESDQETYVGLLLHTLIDGAKPLLEMAKENIRQQALSRNPHPGTVKIGSCRVTIPEPQYRVKDGIPDSDIIDLIGEERFRKLFEKRERVDIIMRQNPTPEESQKLLPLLDRVEHTPRVSFKK